MSCRFETTLLTSFRVSSSSLSIVLVVRSLNYGGAERQLIDLAKGLHDRGHSVLVAVSYDKGPLLTELRTTDVPVAVLAKRGRWDVVGYLWRLARLLRQTRPQVLYAFLVEPSIQAVFVKPMLPRTRIVWGVRASNVDLAGYGWFPRLTFRLSRYLARHADLIIANSSAGAIYHRAQGYPADRITVVPNGIDLARFVPDADAGRRKRIAWGVPEPSVVIGNVGRLDRMKDHATLLDAAVQVLGTRPDAFFVCVGDGPRTNRCELEARALALGISPRVKWVGTEADMTAVYNGFDVCCLCSAFGEGFSNVLGEAMACGIPCVATDVGDATKIIDMCGVIVPPASPTRLAQGILRLLTSVDAERKRACRQRIAEEFSLERMVDRTEQLLHDKIDALL